MNRRFGRLPAMASVILAAVLAAGVVTISRQGAAAPPGKAADRESVAKALLAHHYDRFGTQALGRALRLMAGAQQSPGRQLSDDQERAATSAAGGPAALPRAGVPNVLVNNPGADRFQVDQTTQSETTIAVAGDNVAVGFNDSQQGLLALTDGLDLTGYAYSTNGGQTFTDGGALPNPLNFVNLGDPTRRRSPPAATRASPAGTTCTSRGTTSCSTRTPVPSPPDCRWRAPPTAVGPGRCATPTRS